MEEMLYEKAKDHTQILLRTARPSDAARLVEIYAPYVTDTAITFEYEVPSVEEFRGRIEKTLEKYPYIVAEQNGRILGYAYASAFARRAAYNWSVELSIYLDMEIRRQGIGGRLYKALEEILKEKQEAWKEMTPREHVEMYESQGNSRKEAMRLAARDRGVPRREIYQALLTEEEKA